MHSGNDGRVSGCRKTSLQKECQGLPVFVLKIEISAYTERMGTDACVYTSRGGMVSQCGKT